MLPYLMIGIFIIAIGGMTTVNARDPQRNLLGRRPFRARPMLVGMGIIFIVLALFSGLRGTFTTDHGEYLRYFHYVSGLSFWDICTRGFTMERGFVIFSHLFGLLTDSDVLYILTLSIITLSFVFIAFQERSVMPCLSIILFVSVGNYYESFNTTRQVLAISLAFWATRYINEKKADVWKYLIWILLASMIHRTVLIMIPFYAVKWIRPNFWVGVACIVTFVAAWIILPIGVWCLQQVFPQYGSDFGMGSGTINSVVPFLGIGAFVWMGAYCSDVDYNKIENRVQLFGLIGTLFFLGLGVRIYLFTRMASYFKPLVCILIANVVYHWQVEKMPLPLQKLSKKLKLNDTRWKVLLFCVIAAFAVAYVYVWLSGTGYDPYYWIGGWR